MTGEDDDPSPDKHGLYTSEHADIPTVDADDVPDGAFDGIDTVSVDDMTIDDVTAPAESLIRSFDHDVGEAIASALWHTIVDDAGTEAFVDDFALSHFRDAEHELRSNGFANDGLTKTDLYADDKPEGAAFFVGVAVADMIREHADRMYRVGDEREVDATGDELPGVDGFLVEEASGLPSHLAVFLDVDAIARVPAEARSRSVGLDSTPTVSSPVIVQDPGGIAVVNIADDGGGE